MMRHVALGSATVSPPRDGSIITLYTRVKRKCPESSRRISTDINPPQRVLTSCATSPLPTATWIYQAISHITH